MELPFSLLNWLLNAFVKIKCKDGTWMIYVEYMLGENYVSFMSVMT
jgi:hypothetical protein